MALNVHNLPLICILMNTAYQILLQNFLILFFDLTFMDKDISVVHFEQK